MQDTLRINCQKKKLLYKFTDVVDILAAVKENEEIEEPQPQPNRGNKVSKKSKKKNKNQDWDDESDGIKLQDILFDILFNIFNIVYCHLLINYIKDLEK